MKGQNNKTYFNVALNWINGAWDSIGQISESINPSFASGPFKKLPIEHAGLSHAQLMASIELIGSKVIPMLRQK
jgi:hypothetical protein